MTRVRPRSYLGRRHLAALALIACPAVAQAPELAMLGTLDKGHWAVRDRNGPELGICLRDGRELIQLRHRQSGCSRFVVTDTAETIDVQYTCPGDGYGRTTVRKENHGVAQVRSIGFAGGAPFSIEGEARHTGAC